MDDEEKHTLTPLNILLLIICTIIVIFLIYISVLLISRPPIFSIFGETGGFLPATIPIIITASVLVSIFLSFILMIPSIPIGVKPEAKVKTKTSKTSTSKKSSGVSVLMQTSQPQTIQQGVPATSKISFL